MLFFSSEKYFRDIKFNTNGLHAKLNNEIKLNLIVGILQ